MTKLKDKQWWIAAGIRAIKTVAQAGIATIGAATMLDEVNWLMVGSGAIMAGILSLLTSIAGLPECIEADSESVDDEDELEVE